MLYCRGLKKKWGTNHKFMNYDQNSLPDERKNCREKTVEKKSPYTSCNLDGMVSP
jgi:hypothetical protein